jgi:hypothetical protein
VIAWLGGAVSVGGHTRRKHRVSNGSADSRRILIGRRSEKRPQFRRRKGEKFNWCLVTPIFYIL